MLTQADKNEILKDFAEWSGGYHPSETDDVETYIELALDNKFQDRADEVAEWMMSDEESKRYEKEEESKTRTKYDEKLKGDPNRTGSRLKVKAGSKVAIKELGSYYWVDDGVLWCAPMNADGTMDTFDGMHCPVETVNAKDLKIINNALSTNFHLEDFNGEKITDAEIEAAIIEVEAEEALAAKPKFDGPKCIYWTRNMEPLLTIGTVPEKKAKEFKAYFRNRKTYTLVFDSKKDFGPIWANDEHKLLMLGDNDAKIKELKKAGIDMETLGSSDVLRFKGWPVDVIAEFDDFQPATRRWLKAFINATKQWDNYEKWKSPPIEALQDFKGLGLDEATTLYRGVFWPEAPDLLRALKLKSLPKRGDEFPYNDEHISSWSKRLRSAINFTNGEKYFVVLTYTADPEESFLDLTKVYDSDTAGYIKSEEEVLLKPGRYKVRVERISDAIIDDLRQTSEANVSDYKNWWKTGIPTKDQLKALVGDKLVNPLGTILMEHGIGGSDLDSAIRISFEHFKISESEQKKILQVLRANFGLKVGDRTQQQYEEDLKGDPNRVGSAVTHVNFKKEKHSPKHW